MLALWSTRFAKARYLLILAMPLLAGGGAAEQVKSKVAIVPQAGHGGVIRAVTFSHDGRMVLSASDDKTLKLWESATGRLLRTIEAHSSYVTSVAFLPDGSDGSSAVSGGWEGTLKLWNVATGKLLRTFEGHAGAVQWVAISPDGRKIAASSQVLTGQSADGRVISGSDQRTIQVWDVATGELLSTFNGYPVVFSPTGRTLLAGSRDKTLNLWDVATGELLRSFEPYSEFVSSLAFSRNGRFALSGGGQTLKLWDVAKGKLLHTFEGHSGLINSVAFSPDGRTALSSSMDKTLKLWDVATGKPLRTFEGQSEVVASAVFSPDGHFLLSGSYGKTIKLWDVGTGKLLRSFERNSEAVTTVAVSPKGRTAVSASYDKTLRLWDAATGKLLRTLVGHAHIVTSAAFSPDGHTLVSGSFDKTIKLWDVVTGELLRTFDGHSDVVYAVVFSPDGRTVLSGSWDKTLKLWDVVTGKLLRTFVGHVYQVYSAAFSPDGRTVLSASTDKTLRLWDVATGRQLRILQGHTGPVYSVAFLPGGRIAASGSHTGELKLWDVATGDPLRAFEAHSGQVRSVAISPDGRAVLSGGGDNTLKLWDMTTGALARTFQGHASTVSSVAFSPDGRTALSGSDDGTVRFWSISSGDEILRTFSSPEGDWLTLIPAGFFDFGGNNEKLLHLVRGQDVLSIGQVHQSLFNPDLLRENLAGDPDSEVRRAAKVINLEKTLDSGPAPFVEITSHALGSQSTSDLVALRARIADRGKGIGRIEWRVNGITAAVASNPKGSGTDYALMQQLALDPGDNTIEVVAYNESNLLASLPARTTINFTGSVDTVKPTLHVFAIGINGYVDKGWRPPGSGETLAFPPLNLAVNDAEALASALKQAGSGQYAAVKATLALDTDATAAGLQQIIERMAPEINPRDTFVLFAAAHGTSHQGRFYLIPQDYDGGTNPASLQERAIGQDRLQDWVANRIKARKAILLLDTCESGALVGGYTRSRIDVPASEAGIGRLHEATGRPVLTAAAEGKPAFEGYEGHGIFTWALLDALKNGDRNGNGYIELSELVAHVQDQVPKIAAKLNGRGRAAVAARGSTDARQSARFGSRGEDFAVVRRLQ
jgi:WD40 repeat protein/uncharacterized caspase-like protein